MNLYTFLFINFVVAFISDILLNDISTMYPITSMLGSLRPYFQNKMITTAGIYAGITIVIATVFVSFITKCILGFYVPYTTTQLFSYISIAYVVGYIIDKMIEYFDIFGASLHTFYKITGSGHSGAIAFIFSILLSYILQKYIIPLL